MDRMKCKALGLILICKTHVNNQFYLFDISCRHILLYLSLEPYKFSSFIDERHRNIVCNVKTAQKQFLHFISFFLKVIH